MELITQDRVPAPLLREMPLESDDYERLYKQVIIDMRHIYRKCQLVHSVLREIRDMPEDMGVDEFLRIFIPLRLDQVTDRELEVMDLEDGIIDQAALHGALTGIIPSELALPDGVPYEVMSPEEDDDEEEVTQEEEDGGEKKVTLDRRAFTKEEWRAIVRNIKEARREKRKAKKPKVEKRKQYRKAHPNAK
jgi:hypothetical protein